ncbi:hypothetical protein R1flu_023272 [Riccia fluitans]|uniref:Uncharacterized protein n=1 Tax=Riccia fluitans TaxID=41844 RepID=A0ABD1XRL8_9MARC
MKRGAAGVAFGKPPHLLDAANLVNIAWNEMSAQSLQICFKKADIISSFRDIFEINSNDLNKLVDLLQNCSILTETNDLDIHEEDVGEDSDDGITVPAAIDQHDVVGLEIRLSEIQESAFLTS